MTTTVTISTLNGFSAEAETHFRLSAELLERAVNRPEFPERVLAASYRGTHFRPRGGRDVHKTPLEILDIILGGVERDSIPDNRIEIAITRDDKLGSRVVGEAIVGRLPFRTAGWFIDKAVGRDTVAPASHMIHEWLHVAGFVHRRFFGSRRDVPYEIGKIVGDLIRSSPALVGVMEDKEVSRAFAESMDIVGHGRGGRDGI